MIFLLRIFKHIKLINIKLLISINNQMIKKSLRKIDRIENNNKLEIRNSLENRLKKIKNFLISNN